MDLVPDTVASAQTRLEAPSPPTPAERCREWVVRHDDSWWFVGCYVGLAVALSLIISLFWLVAVVAVHGVLEWLRQRWIVPKPPGSRWLRVVWELKLDLALILFALALAAYMELVLGVAGLGAAARLGVQTGARTGVRATGWSRALRGVLLSLDDAAQLGRAVAGRGASDPEAAADVGSSADSMPPWENRWAAVDHVAVWGGVVCLVLLFGAPLVTHHDASSLMNLLAGELKPFP